MTRPPANKPPVNNPLGIAWMLGAAVAFSGLFVAVRELGAMLPTFEILFLRSVFTIALMAPWLWREKRDAFRSRRPAMHLLRGASTFTAMSLLFYGVAHSPLADASALQSTYPLFTILLVALLLGERPGMSRWLAALVGFAGILVIVRPGFTAIGPPTAALLGCSIFYAISNTIVRMMAGVDRPTQLVFSVNGTVLMLSAVPALYDWVTPPLAAVPWIGLLALSGYAAHMCLTRALSHGEASVVMPFDYLRLPFAAILGFLLYREVPDAYTLAGGAVIFASVSYIAASETRRK
ncbi:MAG: DMT family transporter [Alphaproteobacteria bacterium]|nr:DMT family transporter [Alphaproteobacteria bacterium]